MSYTLGGLIQSEEYIVRVYGYNLFGTGFKSVKLTGKAVVDCKSFFFKSLS